MYPGVKSKISGTYEEFQNGVVAAWVSITMGIDPVFFGDVSIGLPFQAKRDDFAWTAGIFAIDSENHYMDYECHALIDGYKAYRIHCKLDQAISSDVPFIWKRGDKLQMFTIYIRG
jgi:hypothetical protein